MSTPRKGSYGYTVRINAGIDLDQFSDLAMRFSASSSGDTFVLYSSTSGVFVGASTIRSSVLGETFQSGEWAYCVTGSGQPFATADNYTLELEAKTSGKLFISSQAKIRVIE